MPSFSATDRAEGFGVGAQCVQPYGFDVAVFDLGDPGLGNAENPGEVGLCPPDGFTEFLEVVAGDVGVQFGACPSTSAFAVSIDDEPAPASEWLPYVAACAGAKRPMRVPKWLARRLAGEVAVTMMTEGRGLSNFLALAGLDSIYLLRYLP